MMGYFTLPIAPELETYYLKQFIVICRTPTFRESYSSKGETIGVFLTYGQGGRYDRGG